MRGPQKFLSHQSARGAIQVGQACIRKYQYSIAVELPVLPVFNYKYLIDFLMIKSRDYFKRVETGIDKLRRVGGLACKKMFSRIIRIIYFL